jgi:hypothetical protein
VRVLALAETPARLEVLGKVFGLRHGGDDRLVEVLLVSSLGLGEGLLRLRLALREELLLGGATSLLGGLAEVRVGELLVDLECRSIRLMN